MIKLSDLHNTQEGRPAAVLGGGPSLSGDMSHLPANCILIAVNYHALEIGIRADYMVYNDHPDGGANAKEMIKAIRDFDGLKVSPKPSSDVEFDVEVWTGFYSSNTATWFALWLGCDPVILCGMDCYQGESLYCHPSDADCPVFHYPLENHLRPWYEEGVHKLPHVERVRVMSGPLQRVFPLYLVPDLASDRVQEQEKS